MISLYTAVACFAYMVSELRWRGRPWYSQKYSQTVFDVWTLSHFLHGVMLFSVGNLLLPASFTTPELVCCVFAVECLWESFENRDATIRWFRRTSPAYFGDSVLNSFGDLLACTVGAAITSLLR